MELSTPEVGVMPKIMDPEVMIRTKVLRSGVEPLKRKHTACTRR